MSKIPKNTKSHKKSFWRFIFYYTVICDDKDFSQWGYPMYHIKLPRWFNRKSYCGLAWGVFLSHGIELLFIKDIKRFKKEA